MRYTHGFKLIRRRKHVLTISLLFSVILVGLILFLGFTALDARLFFLGFAASFVRILVAFIISLILAIVLSIFVTTSKQIENITLPILDALQSFPSFALAPLLIIWLHKSNAVVIIILVIEMIWPILFTILSAKKQIRTDLLEAAQSFGAKDLNYFVFVLMPLIFPAIVTGSIVAWGEAWETIIAAEIIVMVPGVGTYLSQNGETLNSQVLLVGILLLMMILFLLNKYIWLPLLNLSTKYQLE